ncbi:hypothetical protein [Bartonella sp. HY406]|uniref:hypothetical protein n=1 Tax=Bartonella sp. HY406 TaxID=2979331 RepID=UPI0021CA0C16|nr:hypothetical protein [Bartonella sp. HY406]UXN02608.1 hypothetical protein N6B01_08985 [Bartonella sp. HY406]
MKRHFKENDFINNNEKFFDIFEYYNTKADEISYVDIMKIFIKYLERIKDQLDPKIFKYVDIAKEFYYGKHIGDEKFLEEKRIALWKELGPYSESRFYNEGRIVLYVVYSQEATIKLGEECSDHSIYETICEFFTYATELNPDSWQYIEPCVAEYYADISKI